MNKFEQMQNQVNQLTIENNRLTQEKNVLRDLMMIKWKNEETQYNFVGKFSDPRGFDHIIPLIELLEQLIKCGYDPEYICSMMTEIKNASL